MGYIVRRIAGMDYKNMLKTVGSVHQISGKNRVGLFFDVIRCGLKYGAGYKAVSYTHLDVYKRQQQYQCDYRQPNIRTALNHGVNPSHVTNSSSKGFYPNC